MAKVIEKALKEAAAQRTAVAAELEARLDALRLAARAEFAAVHLPEWWGSADRRQVARIVEVARTWAPHDGEVAAAAQVVKREVQERIGVDVGMVALCGIPRDRADRDGLQHSGAVVA